MSPKERWRRYERGPGMWRAAPTLPERPAPVPWAAPEAPPRHRPAPTTPRRDRRSPPAPRWRYTIEIAAVLIGFSLGALTGWLVGA